MSATDIAAWVGAVTRRCWLPRCSTATPGRSKPPWSAYGGWRLKSTAPVVAEADYADTAAAPRARMTNHGEAPLRHSHPGISGYFAGRTGYDLPEYALGNYLDLLPSQRWTTHVNL